MLTDLLLACLHHLVVFSLPAVLVAELVLLRGEVGGPRLRHAGRVDAVYGILAVAILVIGFARVFHGAKGYSFYVGNPVFWAKIAFFAAVGGLSAVPTIRLLRWNRAARRDASFVAPERDVASTRAWIKAELALFVPIPLLAAAMARGFGLS